MLISLPEASEGVLSCQVSMSQAGLLWAGASPLLSQRVCRLYHIGPLDDGRHMLLECPALADLRDEFKEKFSPLITECSGVMARLVWAGNQPMVSRYNIACLDGMSC